MVYHTQYIKFFIVDKIEFTYTCEPYYLDNNKYTREMQSDILDDIDLEGITLDKIYARGFTDLDIYRDLDVHEIVPGLFLGAYEVAEDLPFLRSVNITTIVRITENPPSNVELVGPYNDKIMIYKDGNILIYHASKRDSTDENMSDIFDDVINIIDDGLEYGTTSILVHCHVGISRSPTVVIAWLMHHRESFMGAYRTVEFKRSGICPNDGFIRQLRMYRKEECPPYIS